MDAIERNEKVLDFKNNIIPELTRSELEERAVEYYFQKLMLEDMVENGLGFEDMINDISPMHEI